MAFDFPKIMIARATGEVFFQDGVCLLPHDPIHTVLVQARGQEKISQDLPAKGWKKHLLGNHPSDRGTFEVEAVTGPEERIHMVFLAHDNPFYETGTPDDSERRAYHEGVIASDLGGQREFPWGQVFCRLDPKINKDWLVVAYTAGAQVPLKVRNALLQISAHEKEP